MSNQAVCEHGFKADEFCGHCSTLVRLVEACDQPKPTIEESNRGLIFGTCKAKSLERLPCSLVEGHNGMHQWRTRGESHGTFSQSHPSLQESGDTGNHFLHAAKYAGVTFEQAAAVACGLLQKGWRMSKSPEPPAGPAFEEFATLAKLAKAIDEADRTNTPQDDWNLRLWRSTATPSVILRLLARASTPIDLNATREEGWISVEDSLPTDSRDVLVFSPAAGFGTLVGWLKSEGEWRVRFTHWQPLPAPPAFVQGIGGKP